VKRWMMMALGLAFSAFFVWLGFRDLKINELIDIIRTIDAGWLILAALVYQLAAYIITWRWYFLLHPVKDVHAHSLFPIVMIGYMGNNIYPARIGEFIRAYLLKKDEQIPYAPSLATIIVERIFDGLVMLSFVFTALLFVEFDNDVIRNVIVGTAPLFFGALLVFSFLAVRPLLARRIYTSVITAVLPQGVQEKVLHLADHFMTGLETLRTPRLLLFTWVSSLASWIVEASTYWLVLRAFDFEVSFFVLMLVMGLANLTTILPSTPGYFGTFHGVVVIILEAFGVNGELAGAYAIVMHLVLWLPVTLFGAFFLIHRGMGWRDLEKATQQVEREAVA
jgi:glycosyltransferase 2 family protein